MEESTQTALVKLQNIELNIAKEFATICDRHGLVYYMLGGTMLGAIRHKGFIPWDDDMDFALLREDYETFQEIASKELSQNLKLINYRNTPDFKYYFSRICDTKTRVIDESGETYASIDVFPIDGAPNLWLLRKLYFFRVLFHRLLLAMCHKDSMDPKRRRNIFERIIISVMGKLHVEKFTSAHKEKDKIDKIMKKHKVEGSKYIGNLMGYYRTKEVVPAEYYGKGEMYPFVDTKFRGLKMYDEYLTWTYGDYMQPPSEEDIDRKTHYKIVELYGEKVEK